MARGRGTDLSNDVREGSHAHKHTVPVLEQNATMKP